MNEELEVYGFGSFFCGHANFHDIDILIVHRRGKYNSCKFAIWCKSMLMSKLTKADITILSEPEERQFSFVKESSAWCLGKVYEASAENDLHAVLIKIEQVNSHVDE